MQEIWIKIPALDYSISNTGKVFSHKRNKEMKLKTTKDGYKAVMLSTKSKKKEFLIHRLVGAVFMLQEEGRMQINHINGNKADNRLCNLEWVTQSENQKHAYKLGLQKPLGINNKLSHDEASEICEAHATGMFTYTDIARKYGMSVSAMRRMIIGDTYGVIQISTTSS